MLSLHTAASIAASPSLVTDDTLRPILRSSVRRWKQARLLDLTHLLIVEPGDTEADIIDEVGFSPLVSTWDGRLFGTEGFQPFWDGLHDRGGWFELIVTVGDSGFAFVLVIADREGVLPNLLALCRTHAEPSQ